MPGQRTGKPGGQNRGVGPPFGVPRQPRRAARTAVFMPAPAPVQPLVGCHPLVRALVGRRALGTGSCGMRHSATPACRRAGGRHKASEARASNLRQLFGEQRKCMDGRPRLPSTLMPEAVLAVVVKLRCNKRLYVAVGTRVTSRPPHRSVHETFPHTAPTSGPNASSNTR
jgi:hypothetical protein